MQATPLQEHHWLERLVGEWTFEGECSMGPDQQAVKSSGTESTHSLGGLWVVCSGTSAMPDGNPMASRMTLGYDPAQGRFVGTFVASCMTKMWVYEGTLDEAGTTLTLNAEGPGFADPAEPAKYQDIIELHGTDRRVLRSRVQSPDGQWHDFMRAEYRRAA
ncbi:MAG TPA: DUF1579 domain-containing protein [Urbifossiella sp.]|jgi:hypothetical protein|nr:DUF1579 domain-containing protein [Urbifossiella sp.]